MKKLITFVVPSYNSEDYLHIAVDSLLKGGNAVEILIVNDGSTDRTGEIGRDYEKRYPGIVRLLEQENGGHGEGINHGLKEAKGLFFKVVDSDDWVGESALKSVLRWIAFWDKKGTLPDMLVANYVYVNRQKNKKKVIRFNHPLPTQRVVGWEETKTFFLWQNLTLHSCMFRTEIIKKSKVVLPKHTFYEDNYFVYVPMAHVEKLAYLDVDFYQYLIGRDGQSVADEGLRKHCMDQVRVSKLCFDSYDLRLETKKNKKRGKCLSHHLKLMMSLGTIFPRLHNDREHDDIVRSMWKHCFKTDYWRAMHMRYFSYVAMLNFPGKAGRSISGFIYHLSNLAVPFN